MKLHADGDVLVVRVRDDDPGKEDGVSGFGLRGMRERAYLAGSASRTASCSTSTTRYDLPIAQGKILAAPP